MDTPKRKLDIGGYIFGICFVLLFLTVGILVLIGGYNKKTENENFIKNGVSLQAECVKISGGKKHHANFKYEYEGYEYYLRNVRVSKSTKIGKTITVYIYPEKPGYAHTDDSNNITRQIIAGWLFASIGIIAAGIGILAFVYNRTNPNGIYYVKRD